MKNQTEDFTPEEKLRNESEILKLKLEIEKGAFLHISEDAPRLPAEIEHAWLSHVYDYERLCKEAGYTSVYELVGSPTYKKIDELEVSEVGETLNELLKSMYHKGIKLTFELGCYTPSTIYTFITEELFKEEVCRYIGGPEGGGHRVFCYEEFHPNHRLDLVRATMECVEQLFGEDEWNPKFLEFTYETEVTLNGTRLSLEEYSNCIFKFREQFPNFLFSGPKLDDVQFDLESAKAESRGTVEMINNPMPYTIHFTFTYGLWLISGLDLELAIAKKN